VIVYEIVCPRMARKTLNTGLNTKHRRKIQT
jgi:hypothetical protein